MLSLLKQVRSKQSPRMATLAICILTTFYILFNIFRGLNATTLNHAHHQLSYFYGRGNDHDTSCSNVYRPLGFIPRRDIHVSSQVDPHFNLIYAAPPKNISKHWIDGCRERRANISRVCEEYEVDGHFSAEYLLAIGLAMHPQVRVCPIQSPDCELGQATLVFAPLMRSVMVFADAEVEHGAFRKMAFESPIVRQMGSTNSLVFVDLWCTDASRGGIRLLQHGCAGSDQGYRLPFTQDPSLFGIHSRHIIIPYGHLMPIFYNLSESKTLDPRYRRRYLIFYMGSPNRLNAQNLRSSIAKTISSMKEAGQHEVSVTHFTGDISASDAMRMHLQDVFDATFCPCPRGDSDDTRRIFTAILGGCIPVIGSDWIVLPFESMIDWETFSIFSKENDLSTTILSLADISEEVIVKKRAALLCVRNHFLYHEDKSHPGDAVDMIMAELSRRSHLMRGFSRWFRQHPTL